MAKADDLKARLGPGGPPWHHIPNTPPSIPDHELVRCIGRGSYGEVWLARTTVGTWRAVKVVYRESFKDARPYDREFDGIQKYEPISRANEGLVDVLQIGRNEAEGYFYYVMELADDSQAKRSDGAVESGSDEGGQAATPLHPAKTGVAANGDVRAPGWSASPNALRDCAGYVPKTLSSEIQARGRLSVEDCITLGITLSLALGYLHRQGLIHRDVKPSNIIFVNGVAKLADIGLVTDLAGAQSFVGTEGFMPPEGPNSRRADLYALGKVLYEAAMGKDRHDFPEPFTNLGMDSESAALMELNEVLLKACAAKAKERYQTAEDMNADLALLLAGKSVRRTHALERRLKITRLVAVATVAVLVLGVAPYYVAIKEARRADREAQGARRAEADAKEKLWSSYLSQAQALRWSHRGGSRFESLEILKKAARMRPALELRNEAIACLALRDMRLVKEFRGTSTADKMVDTYLDFDLKGWRYARRDEQGDISVRSLADDRELGRLPGFGAKVGEELDFSPDGRLLVAYAGRGEKVKPLIVWDVDRATAVLRLTNDFVRTPEFSRDNSLIVLYQYPSAEIPSALLVYDLLSGRQKASIPVPKLPYNFRLRPDGRELAVSITDQEAVQLMDITSGAIRQELIGTAAIKNLAWHPSGSWLAATSGDGNNVLWNPATGEKSIFKAHESASSTLCFSHDGELLASTGWDGRLVLQEALEGAKICSLPIGLYACAFSPDDRWLACQPSRAGPGLVEVAAGHECRMLKSEAPAGAGRLDAFSCAFSPDGQLLASAHADGLRLWSAGSGKQVAFQPAAGRVFAVRFSPSGDALVSSGENGVQVSPLEINPADSSPRVSLLTAQNLASPGVADWDCFGFAAGAFTVVSGGKVHVIEFETKREKRLLSAEMAFRFAALSADGKWCAAGSEFTNSVCVFELGSGKMVKVLTGSDSAGRLGFSPDSRSLVMCGGEEYRFWDTTSWRLACTIPRKTTAGIRGCIAFSGDSRMAAITYSSLSIQLVDPSTGAEFATLEPREPVNIASLAFSPDGAKLAVATWTKTIQLWDLRLIRTELAGMSLDWSR